MKQKATTENWGRGNMLKKFILFRAHEYVDGSS